MCWKDKSKFPSQATYFVKTTHFKFAYYVVNSEFCSPALSVDLWTACPISDWLGEMHWAQPVAWDPSALYVPVLSFLQGKLSFGSGIYYQYLCTQERRNPMCSSYGLAEPTNVPSLENKSPKDQLEESSLTGWRYRIYLLWPQDQNRQFRGPGIQSAV
jgi:hypothetical protein